MRAFLSRRGIAVVIVIAIAAVAGFQYGGRSLNAIVVPGFIAVVATGAYLIWIDEPTVTRMAPEYGHQGETVSVTLMLESRRSFPAVVTDEHSDGLRGETKRRVVSNGRPFDYELTLDRRGEQTMGACRIRAIDPLGLWWREFTVPVVDHLVVFPPVRRLSDAVDMFDSPRETADREYFDAVRQYTPGDPLRNVNWKASAKRADDLYVTTFAGTGDARSVTMAIESSESSADSVAEAAASIATYLIEQEAEVGLCTPLDTVEPGIGSDQRSEILALLAEFNGGTVEDECKARADIRISGNGGGGATVVIGEDRRPFEQFSRDLVAGGVA